MYGTVEDGPKCNRVERRQSRRPGRGLWWTRSPDAATLWSRLVAVPGDRGCRRRLCGPRKRPHPAQGCCRARGARGRRRARTRGAYRHHQVFPTYTNFRSLYSNLRQRSDPRRDVRTSSRSRASVWQSLRRLARVQIATGARLKVFLANLGTPSDFTARTTFAKNFSGVAASRQSQTTALRTSMTSLKRSKCQARGLFVCAHQMTSTHAKRP
jgi:hypothetical protein